MKKILTVAAVAMAVAVLLGISAFADQALPENVKGEATYALTMIEDFEDLGTRASVPAGRCTIELVDGIGATGKALKFVSGENTSETTFKMAQELDFRGYDGLLVWVDISGCRPKRNDAVGIGVRLWSLYSNGGDDYMWTRNTKDPVLEDFEIVAYYLEDGEWKATDPSIMDGERNQLPNGYKGWVYIPFSSYITVHGPKDKPVAGLYNEDLVNKFMLLTGPYDFKNADGEFSRDQVIVFDDLQLVKLGVSQDGLEAALKEARGEEDDVTEESQPADSESESEFDPFAEDDETTAKKDDQTEKATPNTDAGTKKPAEGSDNKSNTGLIIGIIAGVVVAAGIIVAVVLSKKKK